MHGAFLKGGGCPHKFICLQDGPFLALRMMLLIKYDVNSYMHIFFTVKNTLVLLLMFYRLYVVYETRDAGSRR